MTDATLSARRPSRTADPYRDTDVIDARALYAGAAAGLLPSIGFTAYGGPGNDTIYGSQAGDHLAGGSGDDLIVGHSGFGSTLFLRELYPTCPIVNFFEYYYLPHDPDSDMDFRKDLAWPTSELKYLRSRCRNAMILLDLQNCNAAYTPTEFQKSRFPAEYLSKLQVFFDGVDRSVYHGHEETLRPPPDQRTPRQIGGVKIPRSTRVVTYVSRGFESMRGFDIFMRAAKKIYTANPNVVFLIVGSDRVAYGGDMKFIQEKTFREHVLKQDTYDPSRLLFLGPVPPAELARIFSLSDLHIYLTVPFVLSWSLLNAMACGCVVLASDTAPVREVVVHGENG